MAAVTLDLARVGTMPYLGISPGLPCVPLARSWCGPSHLRAPSRVCSRNAEERLYVHEQSLAAPTDGVVGEPVGSSSAV